MIRLLLAALVAIIAQPAAAFENMLPLYETAKPVKAERVSNPYKSQRKAKPRTRVVRKAKPAPAEPTRVLAAEYRTEDVTRCLAPVRVVGSQDVREQAAEDSAKKAWAEHVRWAHGEAFQDFQNARDFQKRCSRSSIGEAMGQYFTRCEITASPCRPGMVKGGVE